MFWLDRLPTQIGLPPWAMGALMALGVLVTLWGMRRIVRSRTAHRRAARAMRGERRALPLLRQHGYRVHDSQLAITYHPRLAGAAWPVALRADYLVTQKGKRYVAEVKTGERAPSLAHAPTRRQLLEYSVAFDVDGVLLVDVEAGLVREVEFPRGPASRRPSRALTWALAGAVAVLGLLLVERESPTLRSLWSSSARSAPAAGFRPVTRGPRAIDPERRPAAPAPRPADDQGGASTDSARGPWLHR